MTTPFGVTFYSFKGGVGRTTLLVNVAHALAARGERVVIWDLDLEAPGVHHFPGLGPPEQPWQSGFLEALGDLPPVAAASDEPAADWPPPAWLRGLMNRVYPVAGPREGAMFVLPAHGTDAHLGKAYAAVDWHALFVQRPWHGVHLFKRVRDALAERFEPTFVFVDSRTGVTDLGGILTGFWPDCTVLVGNYGAQSRYGLRSVYVALDRFASAQHLAELRRDHRLERILVASPVPEALRAREQGRARWSEGFSGVAPQSIIEVPLDERLLYAEDLLVRSSPSSDAARAYHAVAEQLLQLRETRRPRAPTAAEPGDAEAVAQIETLLRLLGFQVQRQGEALVADDRRLSRSRLLVASDDGKRRTSGQWEAVFEAAARAGAAEGMEPMAILSRRSDGIRAIGERSGVRVQTIADLEAQLFDLPAYAALMRRTFEDSVLARRYVPQRFAGGRGGGETDAVTASLAWLRDPRAPRLMMVVGDDGSGKSSYLRRLAYELVTRSTDDDPLPVPLLIDLRPVTSASSLESVLQQHLRTAIGWYGNPEALLYLLRAGRIVLLLDGLDEMVATAYGIGAEEQLRMFAAPTRDGGRTAAANRVIITCARQLARDEVTAATLAARVGAQVNELAPFDDEQIARFLTNRLGSQAGDEALGKIQKQALTAQMATRPMVLELLAAAGPSEDGEGLTAASLFERDTGDWLQKGKERARVVERLAAEVWKLPDNALNHAVLAGQEGVDPAALDAELRTAPFLQRSEEGVYAFIHRSYLEYFMARHLVRQALAGGGQLMVALATEPLTPGCASLFRELASGPSERWDRLVNALRIARGSTSPSVAVNATQLLSALL